MSGGWGGEISGRGVGDDDSVVFRRAVLRQIGQIDRAGALIGDIFGVLGGIALFVDDDDVYREAQDLFERVADIVLVL